MYDAEYQLECDDTSLRERIEKAYDFCSTLTGGLEGEYTLRVLPKEDYLEGLKGYDFDEDEIRYQGNLIDKGYPFGQAFRDEALISGGSSGDALRFAVHEVQGHGYMFLNTEAGHAMRDVWDDVDRYNPIHRSCKVSGEGFATWMEEKHTASRGWWGKVVNAFNVYDLWLSSLFGQKREYHKGVKQCRHIDREFGEHNVAIAYRIALDVDIDREDAPEAISEHLSLPENNPDRRFEYISKLKNPGIDKDDTAAFESYVLEQLASIER